MNSNIQPEPSGLVPERVIESMKASHGAKMLRESPFLKRYADSPLVDAFCTVLGPVADWLSDASNSVSAIVCTILAPFIALLLLPLAFILIPAFLIFATAGMTASSVRPSS
jgi:hypothetical protein